MDKQVEISRLELQSDRHKVFDLNIIDKIIREFDSKLTVLDIGCSNGYRSYSRFAENSNIKHIIGIDIDKSAINVAQKNYSEIPKLRFEHLDFSKEDDIKFLKKEYPEGFDIVHASYAIHFIKDHQNTLRNMYSLLKKNGILFIRDLDDSAKIFYPDPNQICNYVINKTKTIPGQSDRESSRKLYHYAIQAGFKYPKMYYDIKDTINTTIQERKELFTENFSFRLNRISELISKGEEKYRDDYIILKSSIEKIEKLFHSEDFYYMEVNFVFIAKK